MQVLDNVIGRMSHRELVTLPQAQPVVATYQCEFLDQLLNGIPNF